MNKHQKLFNKQVKLQIICYENMSSEKQTYRWHRCQMRIMLKRDEEYDIKSMRYWNIEARKNLIRYGYIKC